MIQSDFAEALLDPERAEPEGLKSPAGGPAGRRFNVYRNNVAASLTEALEVGFPALVTLIGPKRFKTLAGMFLRAHPPRDPRLMLYGAGLGEFIEGVEPLAPYPYLPDVARLELALRDSYHAADHRPIDPQRLGAIAPDKLAICTVTLAPSLRLFRSAWPVHAIWLTTRDPDAPKPQPGGQDVLITRPDLDPRAEPIQADEADAVALLLRGAPLGEALAACDATALLTRLLQSGAIVELTEGDPE